MRFDMHTRRNWGILGHSVAALSVTLALAANGIAGATGVSASAGDTAVLSASQIVNAWHNAWMLSDGVGYPHGSAAGYSASLSSLLFSARTVEWCAWSGSALGSTNSLARTNISALETSMKWRSNSFSIAGSRVWSKVIKFTSAGINVRLPLN
jgi:hypothetical protein